MELKRHAVYELKGRGLDAAKKLRKALENELKRVDVKSEGDFLEIRKSWTQMYKALFENLKSSDPDLVHNTGLDAPSVMVYKSVQSLPRAYEEFPEIYMSPEREPRYFMYVPVDYKGQHFEPADSELLDEESEQMTGNLLFAGGWLGNAPIFERPAAGVATPSDYKPPEAGELRKAFSQPKNDEVVFLALGKTLEILDDYNNRVKAWKQKLETASKAVKATIEKDREEILSALPAGEDIHIGVSYSYMAYGGGKAELELMVTRQGKNDFFAAGRKVEIPPCNSYFLQDDTAGRLKVLPRTDTPDGRELANIMEDIPVTPGLKDYPELLADYHREEDAIEHSFGINGNVPRAEEIAGYKLFIYTASPQDINNSFCPPDSCRFPVEAYKWLKADEIDKGRMTELPPAPEEVTQALAKVSNHDSSGHNGHFNFKSPEPL